MSEHSYQFIINPFSGNKKDLSQIISLIKSRFDGLRYELKYSEYAGHASVLAREGVEQDINVIVAVGGDGTLNEVGSALIHSKATLGLIPRGSGNGFARSLGIPLNIHKAVDTLLNPNILTIDTAQINKDYFFGVAGAGFDGMVAHAFQTFGPRGPLPYFYLGTKSYFNYNYPEFRITQAGHSDKIRPLTVTIANTAQYGNGATIAPQADFQDGLLEVCIVERIPWYKMLQSLKLLFNGKIGQSPFYSTFQVKKIVIENGSRDGIYHIDGEPKTGGRILNIEIVPKSLRIITPK